MAKQDSVIEVSKLKDDPSATLKRIRRSNRPIVVTERGKAAAVLLSVTAYEKGKKERDILRLLALGETEIAKGKGYDLDAVFAEADKILNNR